MPIGQCDGSCEEDSENEPAESEPEEDDLDGRGEYYDGGEQDFGPEPYGTVVDAWGCHHIWTTAKSLPEGEQSECHLCYRPIHLVTTGSLHTDHEGDTLMSGTTWQCAGAHMICPTCPRPPESAKDKSAVSYSCWCGASYCHICDSNEKIMELETAYECRCGMRICGACKDNFDS